MPLILVINMTLRVYRIYKIQKTSFIKTSILITRNTLSSGYMQQLKKTQFSLSLSAWLILVATEVCLSEVSLQIELFKTSTYTRMDIYTKPGKQVI